MGKEDGSVSQFKKELNVPTRCPHCGAVGIIDWITGDSLEPREEGLVKYPFGDCFVAISRGGGNVVAVVDAFQCGACGHVIFMGRPKVAESRPGREGSMGDE